MIYSERIAALREKMRALGVDLVYVPSDDFHQSEYVGAYFRSRAWLSGFSGSAGELIVTADEALLFTDGRYYIQAERELAGSGVTLMRAGSEGVPTPAEWMGKKLTAGQTAAYDGRCVSSKTAGEIRKKLPGVTVRTDLDFPGMLWENRPALPSSKLWRLDEKYAGRSHAEKREDVRAAMAEKGCTAFVLSTLADIAWFYDLRADDVPNSPVFLAFCVLTENEDKLYVGETAAADVKASLLADGVTVLPYGQFFDDLKTLAGEVVLYDKAAVSDAIVSALAENRTVDAPNPTLLLKAKKNAVELENLRRCHVADGLAVTKLMLALRRRDPALKDELAVERAVLALRRECAELVGVTFVEESFGTIAAYGANAAMMHYKANARSNTALRWDVPADGSVPMLLVDSGGHYLEGTTDITRTFVLGKLSDEVKEHYTRTACGMLRLLAAKFLDGMTGASLDVLCREPLWEIGIDYRCGTGHGVGYLLSVHEGPNRFQWRTGHAKIEPGMVTTDEPGVYVENSHGIRIENELAARLDEHNEYGQFLSFENLTFCPIDLDGIDRSKMDESDVRRLNAYHRSVYETLSPYFNAHECEELAAVTRAI